MYIVKHQRVDWALESYSILRKAWNREEWRKLVVKSAAPTVSQTSGQVKPEGEGTFLVKGTV